MAVRSAIPEKNVYAGRSVMGEFRIVGEGVLPTVPITSTVAHPSDPLAQRKVFGTQQRGFGMTQPDGGAFKAAMQIRFTATAYNVRHRLTIVGEAGWRLFPHYRMVNATMLGLLEEWGA